MTSLGVVITIILAVLVVANVISFSWLIFLPIIIAAAIDLLIVLVFGAGAFAVFRKF